MSVSLNLYSPPFVNFISLWNVPPLVAQKIKLIGALLLGTSALAAAGYWIYCTCFSAKEISEDFNESTEKTQQVSLTTLSPTKASPIQVKAPKASVTTPAKLTAKIVSAPQSDQVKTSRAAARWASLATKEISEDFNESTEKTQQVSLTTLSPTKASPIQVKAPQASVTIPAKLTAKIVSVPQPHQVKIPRAAARWARLATKVKTLGFGKGIRRGDLRLAFYNPAKGAQVLDTYSVEALTKKHFFRQDIPIIYQTTWNRTDRPSQDYPDFYTWLDACADPVVRESYGIHEPLPPLGVRYLNLSPTTKAE